MDERFDFVYEDLDYSHTLQKSGHPIIVLKALKIFHMEREKNKLEQAWVGNIYQAYRKAKHRMMFVKKHATSGQKIQFYLLGFRGQPLRLIIKVLLLGEKKKRLPLIKAIWRGTWDGISV